METKENKIKITVATPEGRIYEGEADFISVPAKSGSMGILPRHIPIIAQLKTGILKIISDGATVYVGVCRGYFELLDHKAYVLTERAVLTDAEHRDAVVAELKKKHDITSEITEETKIVLEAIARLKTLNY